MNAPRTSLGRVLVVDDEALLRETLRLVLTNEGYDVIEAEDGEQAMATLASGDNPSKVVAIVCDLYMPKVGGREAIGHFHSKYSSIPIIVMTGKPDFPSDHSLFQHGVVAYLAKPIGAEAILAVVREAVKHRIPYPGPD